MVREEVVEALKEGLRVFLMAVIPLLVIQLETQTAIDLRPIATAGIIAVLRFVDKYLHNTGRKTGLELDALNKLK